MTREHLLFSGHISAENTTIIMMKEEIQQLFSQVLTEDLFKNIAKVYGMFYRALLSEGFTSDQAIEILTSQNGIFPSSGNKSAVTSQKK